MKMTSGWLGALLAVSLVCGAASAQSAKLYKWFDKDGKVTYQDQPPPANAGKVEEKIVKDGGAGDSDVTAEIARKYPVVIYTIPKCSSCDLARSYLQKRLIPFTEKIVSGTNVENQKEMQAKIGELIVPTIVVGTRIMKGGYSESLLEGELDQAGYPNPSKPAPSADASAQPQQ